VREWYERPRIHINGKQRITNGHMRHRRQDFTRYFPSTKTPQMVVGVIKSRDGDEDQTSKPRNEKKWWNRTDRTRGDVLNRNGIFSTSSRKQ
jgi:hypothetical protein